MASNNKEIVDKVLSMSESELQFFLASLKPSTLEYLDVILAKAERQLNK